jgi:hypothetical protein
MGVTTSTGSVKTLLDIEKIFLDDASITRALPDGSAREGNHMQVTLEQGNKQKVLA